MKFILLNARYGLTRHKIISAAAAALVFILTFFTCFYFSSVYKNREEMDQIQNEAEIQLKFVNIAGMVGSDLSISGDTIAELQKNESLSPEELTAKAFFSKDIQKEGNIPPTMQLTLQQACGIYSEAMLSEASPEYADSYSGSVFSGNDDVCLLSREYMEENGLEVGGSVTLYLYTCVLDGSWALSSHYISPAEFKIAGSFQRAGGGFDMYMPFNTLSRLAEGRRFMLSKAVFNVTNPESLNEIKAQLKELGVTEPKMRADASGIYGNTAVVSDRSFILSMEPLSKNQAILEVFRLPLFLAAVVIGFFVFYLAMRNRRAEIATELSLGVPKKFVAAHLLIEVLVLALAGALAAGALFGLLLGLPLSSSLTWGLAISACCLGGGLVSVLMLINRKYSDLVTGSE